MKIYKLMVVAFALTGLLCNCSSDSSERYVAPAEAADPTDPAASDPGVHAFTGLPLTEDGWTDFAALIQGDAAAAVQAAYDDARVVFVSSSDGDDDTGQIYTTLDITFDENGMFQASSPVNAFATLAEAYNQLRDGYPDILLLKRDDEWQERFDLGSIGRWDKSGPSSTARIILGSYGSGERPTLLIGNGTGFVPYYASNLIVSGIRFYSHTWETETPDRSIDIAISGQSDHLYEDCVFERNVNNVQNFQRMAFRRNNFIEGLPDDLTAKLYAFNGDGLLLEENIFHSPVEKNRHLYLSGPADGDPYGPISGLITIGNIFYTSQRTGLSHRANGLISNNLIVRNDQILVGGTGGSQDEIKSVQLLNNVFLESVPDSVGDGEYSIRIQNNDGSSFYDNIWTDNTNLGLHTIAILLTGDEEVHIAKNIDIYDNIVHGWSGGGDNPWVISTAGDFQEVENVNIYDNDFQQVNGGRLIINREYDGGTKQFEGYTYSGNRYYSTEAADGWFTPGDTFAGWAAASGETGAQAIQVDYPDAGRNLKTYNASLGGVPSTEEFMVEALKQARHNWRSEYRACAVNNYIREGFGKETVECGF